MKRTKSRCYQPHEFAKRARVTVRTLHHYDRIGLLKPSAYTGTGFRIYRDDDFVRLQQIVTLKFIGFSLKQIKRLVEQKGSGLAATLRAQRKTLEQKRRHLDAAIKAIANAETVAVAKPKDHWETFQKITEKIQMQTNTDWTKKYYNDEAQKLIAERQQLWSPELQKDIEEEWTALLRDIESAAERGLAPDSAAAQKLLERNNKLIEAFTGGHQAIGEGLAKLWSEQANWPKEAQETVFTPFAERGVAAAQGSTPRLLSEKAEAFMDAVRQANQKQSGQ